MKKMSSPLLFSFMAADFVLAVGIIKLADFSIVCLLGEVVLAIIAAVMGYVLVNRLAVKYAEQQSLLQHRLDGYKVELCELKESCQQLSLTKNEELDERISRIISVQADSAKNIEKFCGNMVSAVDAIDQRIGNLLRGLEQSLEGITEDAFGKMDKLIGRQSEEINHSRTALCEQLQLVNKGIEEQIALSEKRTLDMQNSIGDEIEKQNAVIDTMQKFFENKLQDMHEEHNMLLSNIKEDISLYTGELDSALKTYSNDVSIGLSGIWDDKFGTLSQDCKAYLGNISESVINTFIMMDDMIEKQSKEIDHSRTVLSEQFDSIEAEIENQNTVIGTMQKFFKNGLQDMHDEHNMLLSDIKQELLLHIEELNKALETYSSYVSVGLSDIWDAKFGILSKDCEAYLENVSECMVSDLKKCNSELLEMQTDQDHKKISGIAEKYDVIMEKYIAYLKQEVSTGITNFQNVNRKAFEDHAAYTEMLIQTEEDFVSKLGKNNETLKELISEGYRECKNASEDAAALLGTTLSGYNEIVVNGLAKKLEVYSNDLVEKSAEAIANVQKDNNLKLQQMCDSIILYSDENTKFTQKYAAQNQDTKQRMDELIDQNRDFLDKLNMVSDDSIKGMGETLDGYLEKMEVSVEKLNVENSNRFEQAMVQYRDIFVNENAKALANVQGTNVDAIKKAYLSIANLSDTVQTSNKNNEKHISDMSESISEGSEDIEQTVGEMKKLTETQFEKYEELLDKYREEINVVLKIVKENTQNYEKTLKRIVDAQKEMNTLTTEDRRLLEKLIGR